jgi:hypothetical protein
MSDSGIFDIFFVLFIFVCVCVRVCVRVRVREMVGLLWSIIGFSLF